MQSFNLGLHRIPGPFVERRLTPHELLPKVCYVSSGKPQLLVTKVVRLPVLQVPVLSASRTLWTGGTQSFQP